MAILGCIILFIIGWMLFGALGAFWDHIDCAKNGHIPQPLTSTLIYGPIMGIGIPLMYLYQVLVKGRNKGRIKTINDGFTNIMFRIFKPKAK